MVASIIRSKAIIIAKVFICGSVALVSATVAAGVNPLDLYNKFMTRRTLTESLLTENGFRFELLMKDEMAWLGNMVGSQVDLSRMIDAEGKTLANMDDRQGSIMLVLVDPDCGICTASADMMDDVHNQINSMGIGYYVVSFNEDNKSKFFDYAYSIQPGVASFMWAHEESKVPSTLELAPTPTHMLIRSDNSIEGIWPGTSSNASVRKKMAQQIMHDVANVISKTEHISVEKHGV